MPKKAYFEVNQEDLNTVVTTVKFSHGQLNESKSSPKWQMYRKRVEKDKNRKDQRIITAEVGKMKYMGKNFDSNLQRADDTCDYYVGILNKETGKLRVVPAEHFDLHPILEEKVAIKSEEKELNKTYREKTDDLIKEFGSGKMQRSVNKRQKNKLDSEMLSTSTKSATDNAAVIKDEEKFSKLDAPLVVTQTSAVPPHNKDATRPEDVYQVADIIPPLITSSLDQMAQVFINCSKEEIEAWQREKSYCKFVLDKLPSLSQREDARRMQCQCLIYIDCLIKVFTLKAQQCRLKDPFPGNWAQQVKRHIHNFFFSECVDGARKRRLLPSQKRDLMLSHVLVLCLKLNSFTLDIDGLLIDLNIPKKRLVTHCQILGCAVKNIKSPGSNLSSSVAILSVPLTFPELGKQKGKRKSL